MAISLDGFVGRVDETDPGLYDRYSDPPAASKPVVDELVPTTGGAEVARQFLAVIRSRLRQGIGQDHRVGP